MSSNQNLKERKIETDFLIYGVSKLLFDRKSKYLLSTVFNSDWSVPNTIIKCVNVFPWLFSSVKINSIKRNRKQILLFIKIRHLPRTGMEQNNDRVSPILLCVDDDS